MADASEIHASQSQTLKMEAECSSETSSTSPIPIRFNRAGTELTSMTILIRGRKCTHNVTLRRFLSVTALSFSAHQYRCSMLPQKRDGWEGGGATYGGRIGPVVAEL
jgi:hypothetical protein